MSYCNGCGARGLNYRDMHGNQCAACAAALTGAQPAPAAPSDQMRKRLVALAEVAFEAGIAHGKGAKNFWGTNGKAEAIISEILAAPAAQPADSAMEVLRSKSSAVQHAHKECAVAFVTYEGSTFHLNEFAQYVTRLEDAIRARALVAKETPHAR